MDLQTFLVNAEKYDSENTAVWLKTLYKPLQDKPLQHCAT